MKKSVIVTVLLSIFCCFTSYAGAGLAAPGTIDITQPDGTTFKATMNGDERQNWVETADSCHTVIRNRVSGFWEYAEKQSDGTLKGSGIKVDPSGKNAPASIPKRVKPDKIVQ